MLLWAAISYTVHSSGPVLSYQSHASTRGTWEPNESVLSRPRVGRVETSDRDCTQGMYIIALAFHNMYCLYHTQDANDTKTTATLNSYTCTAMIVGKGTFQLTFYSAT